LRGSGQHGGATQAVADQQLRRSMFCPQEIGGGQQVVDIRRKIGGGKLALAGAQPREVEAQHGDAVLRQALRDAPRGQHVLAAGKTVGEQRVGADGAVGRVEARRQHMAVRAGKILPGGFHCLRSKLPRSAADGAL